jgi:hypothetical protein
MGSSPLLSPLSVFGATIPIGRPSVSGGVLLEQEQKIREVCEQGRMCEDEAQSIFLLAHLKLLSCTRVYSYRRS